MCMGRTPKYTPPPPTPPTPLSTRKIVNDFVREARAEEQKQARLKAGRSGTVLTNPSTVQSGASGATGKTLLGQ